MYLIEVRFKGNRKEFFHWAADEPPALGAPVIVDADRGEDLGVVHSNCDMAERRFAGTAHGQLAGPVTRQALRLATAEEYEDEHQLRHRDDESARRQTMERVKAHGLTMKVTDAEWQWDRKKLTLYFTAERRVDFRALVRDLASAFRARIELKQIGVRDEAKRLDGIGRCGRQYCSASWLPELRPVNLGVAKDQGLSLNPLQISGACGRLMCCLRYEHEFYVQSRKRFPKEGRILVTARGEEKVVSNDIFNDRVTLRNVEGDVRVAELAELRAEIAAWSDAASGVNGHTNVVDTSLDGSHSSAPSTQGGEQESAHRDSPIATHSGEENISATLNDGESGKRAPRPRRALPVRDSTVRPRSSRPTSRVLAPVDVDQESSIDEVVTRPHLPQVPRVMGAGTAKVGASDGTSDEADDIETDDGSYPDDDVSTEDARRRRRRGRRGGRRGRASQADGSERVAEEASDPGADARTGSDDQGE